MVVVGEELEGLRWRDQRPARVIEAAHQQLARQLVLVHGENLKRLCTQFPIRVFGGDSTQCLPIAGAIAVESRPEASRGLDVPQGVEPPLGRLRRIPPDGDLSGYRLPRGAPPSRR